MRTIDGYAKTDFYSMNKCYQEILFKPVLTHLVNYLIPVRDALKGSKTI